MPDEDNNFGGSLVLDFRKWWRRVQPKNPKKITHKLTIFVEYGIMALITHDG